MGRDAARLSQVPRRRGGAVSGSQQRGVSAGGGPRVGTRMTMLPATHLAMAATRFEADAVRSNAHATDALEAEDGRRQRR
jgi:hypothetical protein